MSQYYDNFYGIIFYSVLIAKYLNDKYITDQKTKQKI